MRHDNRSAVIALRKWATQSCSEQERDAVERAFKKLRRHELGDELLDITKAVYLIGSNAEFRNRGTITSRVRVAAIDFCMSERTVWRYLKVVRDVVQEELGRVEEVGIDEAV